MPSLATKHRYQTALIWRKEGKVNGEALLSAPEELKVRWDWKRREIRTGDSGVVALDAQLLTGERLEPGDFLWLGGMDDWHGAGIEPGWDVMQVVTSDQVPSIRNRAQAYGAGLQRASDWVPGGWGILRVADLKLWLNADHGLYTTSVGQAAAEDDGDPVGRWTSLDEQGREFLQATAADRGTLKTGVINGKQVVRLDGLTDYLASSTAVQLSDDFTVYLAGDPDAVEQFQGLQRQAGPGRVKLTVGDVEEVVNNAGASVETQTTVANGPVIVRFVRRSNAVTVATTGSAEKSMGSLSGLLSIDLTEQSGVDIRHRLVFDRSLEPDELRLVEDFLKADLGVELG